MKENTEIHKISVEELGKELKDIKNVRGSEYSDIPGTGWNFISKKRK